MIALVTIIVLVIDLRVRHGKVSSDSAPTQSARADRGQVSRQRDLSASDISQMRVDKIGSVPPSELYQVLSRATPEQITALVRKFDDLRYNGPTHAATAVFFQAWSELDGKKALQSALGLKDAKLRLTAINTVVNSVSPYDSPELAKYLLANPDPEFPNTSRGRFLSTLIAHWSETDAPAAANFLDSLGSDTRNALASAGQEIAFSWATVDPSAAIAWANRQQQLHVEGADTLLTYVIRGWCERDIDAAAAYIASHPDEPSASDSVVLGVAVHSLFDQSPDKAANWVRGISSSEARAGATSKLAARWANKDPVAAARWFGNLTEADQSTAAVGLAAVWAEMNFKEASTWISSLQGDIRDTAIRAAIGNAKTISPQDSLSLALLMQDTELRTNVVEGVVQQWLANEPDAARGWIASSSLTSEEKQKLLSPKNDSEPSFDQ